ncbi:MAG TPA: DUF4440 domain-containing protein [Spirochaetota bacterium]
MDETRRTIMTYSPIHDYIYKLETRLLDRSVRKDPDEIRRLLSETFTEFCASGKIYRYQDGDVFDDDASDLIEYVISGFATQEISSDIVLATFQITKRNKIGEVINRSNRSSLWVKHDENWKLTFHQGTLI